MGQKASKQLESYYSTDYINECFYIWYSKGRLSVSSLMTYIPEDDIGNTPSINTVRNWKNKYLWDERADEMDSRVRDEVEKKYIRSKSKMLAKHADMGRFLQKLGKEFFTDKKLKSASVALRAIESGIEIEKDSTSLEKLLETVSQMDDPQIMRKIDRLLPKAKLNVETESEDSSD